MGLGPPPPDGCRHAADVGKLYHDEVEDIWYECLYDPRRDVVTWAIVPPNEPPDYVP